GVSVASTRVFLARKRQYSGSSVRCGCFGKSGPPSTRAEVSCANLLSPPSGYITPIACQYCTAEAHLAQLSHHPELNAELRIFQCEQCGRETELIVLR